DRDTGVALMDNEGAEKEAEDAQVAGDEQVKGRQAKIYQIDMDHASNESVNAASATIATVPPATITVAPVRVVAASTRRRKGVVIKDPEEESTTKTLAETKSKDKGKGLMIMSNKKPRRIRMFRDTRLDYFKGMSYDDIRPIFEAKFNSNIEFLLKSKEQIEEEENREIKSINETPAQKAAKRRKLNKEVKDLKQHLEIVPDEDDDVYTEATPLARKQAYEAHIQLVCSISSYDFVA
nr:hypothetical protein [Tanacetum cinerariifolium]